MTPHLTIEAIVGGSPVLVGTVFSGNKPGSISGQDVTGARQVFLFGWHNDEPGVWLSQGGFDFANSAIRAVTSLGLTKLSNLNEPYELRFFRNGSPRHIRFTLETS